MQKLMEKIYKILCGGLPMHDYRDVDSKALHIVDDGNQNSCW